MPLLSEKLTIGWARSRAHTICVDLLVSAKVQPPDEALDLGVRSANQCDSAKGSREHDEDSQISHLGTFSHSEPFSEVTQRRGAACLTQSSGGRGVVTTSRYPSS
jgi:hypothetical protein